MEKARTRIAPSPTGDPHVGTAYVALFNWALARKTSGEFVLRIEDTDRERSHPAYEKMIMESLKWLGLEWDEGPDVGGPHAPYRQSERLEIYRKWVDELVKVGAAYPCFCSKERLAAVREEQRRRKSPFVGYDRHCRQIPPSEARKRMEQEPYVIRLAMPTEGETVAHDLLRGEIRFENSQLDDQILLKSDGYPTYHLANVVDDHLMGITHVIRAEEWISSLPKHVRLYDALGWQRPTFCHLPLLRNPDRSKISKRKNPVSINYYRDMGFLPEAFLNYLALMGWTMPDGREEFSLEEFVENFSLDRISLGGPVFDLEKLKWLNGRYLRRLEPARIVERLNRQLITQEYMTRIAELVKERVETLAEFMDYSGFFFAELPTYGEKEINKMKALGGDGPRSSKLLRQLLEEKLDQIPEWNSEALEKALRSFSEEKGCDRRKLFMAVRIAVTGSAATPPLFETMAVLGKERCRARLRHAMLELRRG